MTHSYALRLPNSEKFFYRSKNISRPILFRTDPSSLGEEYFVVSETEFNVRHPEIHSNTHIFLWTKGHTQNGRYPDVFFYQD